jgi:hypothetical protein
MKKLPKFKATAAAAALALLSLTAHADLARRGPVDPANGFPTWYQDLNGFALDLCVPSGADAGGLQAAQCLMEIPGPYVFPTNFPDEAFYFRGTTDMAMPNGGRAVLVLAHEAAFGLEVPQAGQQVVFTRIRVVASAPEAGTYTVTHPYGVETIEVDASSGTNRDINFTEDVGIAAGFFDQSLTSRFGPYLRAADAAGNALAPVTINGKQFVADALVPTAVTGSPFNTNYFMICGTRPDGSAIPLGGAGTSGTCVSTNVFNLTGMVHDMVASPIGSPLAVNAATYSRDATGTHINVHAQVGRALATQPAALLSAASMHTPPVRMVGPDVLDRFYTQGFTDPTGALPGNVTVTNSGDTPPTSVVAGTRDVVTIASSTYNANTQSLTVIATSSDKGFGLETPPPLALPGYATVTVTPGGIAGDPASMTLVASGLTVAPATVTVVSQAGGEASVALATDPNVAFAAGSPFAVNDAATVEAGAAAIDIPVLANDLANAAAPINPATLTILAPGVTPNLGSATVTPAGTIQFTPGFLTGTASIKYTVSSDAVPGASNIGELLVTVTPGANGPMPVAVADNAFSIRSRTFAIDVLANDDANGGTLDPASVQISNVSGGTAVVNANGTVNFTTGTTLGNAFGFDYSVASITGVRSAPARATVRVVAETLNTATRAPECRASTRRWRMAGGGLTAGSTVTWYSTATVPATPTAANTIQTVTVAANGSYAFDRTGGPACTTRASVRTEAGTVVQNQAVRQR